MCQSLSLYVDTKTGKTGQSGTARPRCHLLASRRSTHGSLSGRQRKAALSTKPRRRVRGGPPAPRPRPSRRGPPTASTARPFRRAPAASCVGEPHADGGAAPLPLALAAPPQLALAAPRAVARAGGGQPGPSEGVTLTDVAMKAAVAAARVAASIPFVRVADPRASGEAARLAAHRLQHDCASLYAPLKREMTSAHAHARIGASASPLTPPHRKTRQNSWRAGVLQRRSTTAATPSGYSASKLS